MDYKPVKDFGDLTEPLQSPEPGAVVGAQYCSLKAEQFTLENAIFSKDWSITNANGQEVYRVRGKRVDWCKAKRELVDMDGNTIVLMEQKVMSILNLLFFCRSNVTRICFCALAACIKGSNFWMQGVRFSCKWNCLYD